jgi:hypothetical protein
MRHQRVVQSNPSIKTLAMARTHQQRRCRTAASRRVATPKETPIWCGELSQGSQTWLLPCFRAVKEKRKKWHKHKHDEGGGGRWRGGCGLRVEGMGVDEGCSATHELGMNSVLQFKMLS